MPEIGIAGLVVILIVALLVFGPKRLPEIGRSLGKGMREFKDSITGKDDKPELPSVRGRHPAARELAHEARPAAAPPRRGGDARRAPRRAARAALHRARRDRRSRSSSHTCSTASILDWLNRPLPDDRSKPITFSPIEPFSTSIMGQPLGGAGDRACRSSSGRSGRSSPRPSRSTTSARSAMLVAFAAVCSALGGLAFGYWVVLPPAIHFLTNYDSSHYEILLRAKDYYRFVSFVLIGVALAFEVPVFVLGLVRLRNRDRGEAAADLAHRRVRDGRDRGDPPGRRSGDDDPARSSRSSCSTCSRSGSPPSSSRAGARHARRGRPSSRAGPAARTRPGRAAPASTR